MGCTVNDFALRGSLEIIVEGIDDICSTNGEVISGSNGNNHQDCGFC